VTTFGDLVNEVAQTLNGYGLSQPRATFLTAGVTASTLLLPVRNAADFSQGVAEIGDEVVFIESVNTADNLLTVSPDGRGYYGTTAAAHSTNARIECASTWPRHRIRSAINDVILGLYPTLWGVGTASFTFNGVQTTYEVPAEAEAVLAVTADTIGPSNEQQQVRRYAFNSVAPTGDFPSGNSLTLGEAVTVGKTVTVTYLKQLTALAATGDLFTASGLRLTAKPAVVFGTCAHLLAFMDAARLPVDTARADEYDERNAVGIASRIAAQLTARHEMEVEKERKRLRQTTPVAINVRIR
jgi:hypothetical protein